jgi:AcrR family transcriptional regulator
VATDTRDRILDTTAEFFRHYGYNGTGLKQIVAQANAPFGSIYHFFPGGKEQLGGEVIRRSGLMYQELLTAIIDAAPDVVTGIGDCFAGAAAVLLETDYADACPIETVALEVASTNDPLRQATADVFDGWITAATERIAAAGPARTSARELAISVIALLEGAFVLSRSLRSVEPLEAAGSTAVAAVREAVGKKT